VKRVLIAVFFVNLLFAQNLQDMSLNELYQKKYYSYICDKRWNYISKYNNKREDLLSLVAYACLKKRYLTPALDLAKVLKVTKEGRKNATYITTLFLIKKLVLEILNGDRVLKNILLPEILDNTLGVAFSHIQKGEYRKKGKYILVKHAGSLLKIWESDNYNVVVDTIKNGVLQKREFYW